MNNLATLESETIYTIREACAKVSALRKQAHNGPLNISDNQFAAAVLANER